MITHLNVKLSDESNNAVLLNTSLSSSDISDFEQLTTIKFNKQAGTSSFSGNTYTFKNLTALDDTKTYKAEISFKNYHPTIYTTNQTSLSLVVANAPGLINSITISIPDLSLGSTSTASYTIDNNPRFSINWNVPSAGDGNVISYTVQYESTAKLNSASSGNDTQTITTSNTTLSKNLSTGILYGTKYRYRIKATNDAGATAAYGNWITSSKYTTVPSKPSLSRIDTTDINLDNWNASQEFGDVVELGTNFGGSNYEYAKYENNNWNKYDTDNRKLLRSAYVAANAISFGTVTDLNCSNTLAEEPSNWLFKFEVLNESGSTQKSVSKNISGYSSGNTRHSGQTFNESYQDCTMTINLKDKYPNGTGNNTTENKGGFWTSVNISGLSAKIPTNVTKGTIKLTADVPSISTTSFKSTSFDFMTDTLSVSPSITYNNQNDRLIGVKANPGITWICGVASLNANTLLEIDLNATNLASAAPSSGGIFRGDYKQLEVESTPTNIVLSTVIKVNNATYGSGTTGNSGNSISYTNFSHPDIKIQDVSLLGDTTISFTAYNIHGTTSTDRTIKLLRDKNSINNPLLSRRYASWNNSLLSNTSGTVPTNVICLSLTSLVNIVASGGNKYVFNGGNSYDSSKKYGLYTTTYTLTNVPSGHPIAILNNGNTNITYAPKNSAPITIKVSDGGHSTNGNNDFYTFKDVNNNSIGIGNSNFRFMRGQSYKFIADGISSSHPFFIHYSGTSTSSISGNSGEISFTIPTTHSTTAGDLYYQCSSHSNMKRNLSLLNKSVTGTTNNGTYDFYYGDVTITVSGDFGTVSVYCYYHGYMGGENILTYTNTCSPVSGTIPDVSTLAIFNNTVQLPSHELLLWDGNFTSDPSKYIDFRAKYNKNLAGSVQGTGYESVTTTNWTSNDKKWALFKLPNTIQSAGTSSFGIKFTTPSGHSFSTGSAREATGFECNILLPSMLSGQEGTLFWYNVNENYQSETGKDTGTGVNGVTGLGVFDSKTRTTTYTTYKITPPVPATSSQVPSDIWIRIGLNKGANAIQISNIEFVST